MKNSKSIRMSAETAFVFPGQGSQGIDMLKDLDSKYKEVRSTFKEASDIVSRDLYKLLKKGTAEELQQTTNTQPIMLTASVAIWRIWTNSTNHMPAVMAGHSLGEYSALVCSGSLTFKSALHLVSKRAELMQNSTRSTKGSMAAIMGLEKKIIIELCKKISTRRDIVEAVNFNAPLQTVIAGEKKQVSKAMKDAELKGARKCVLLPVEVPSHCSLMKEAAEKFSKEIKKVKIKVPKVKIIHNCDAQSHENPQHILKALVKQLYMPVKWVDTIQNISAGGIEHFVEIGPGRVLSSLIKRIDKSFTTYSINDSKSLNYTLEELIA